MDRGECPSPLPEAQLQEVEHQEPAAERAAIRPEPEDAEDLSHVAGHHAGDGQPKPAQLPMGEVVDDGAEPWRTAERHR